MVTTTDEMDDFKLVTLRQRNLGQGRAGNDLAIAFNRNLGRIEFKAADQIGYTAGCGAAGFTIDGQGKLFSHHPAQIARDGDLAMRRKAGAGR
jgi:hypothetical protein